MLTKNFKLDRKKGHDWEMILAVDLSNDVKLMAEAGYVKEIEIIADEFTALILKEFGLEAGRYARTEDVKRANEILVREKGR